MLGVRSCPFWIMVEGHAGRSVQIISNILAVFARKEPNGHLDHLLNVVASVGR